MNSKARRPGLAPRYAALWILAVIAVAGVAGYYIVTQPGVPPSVPSTLIGQPAPQTVLDELADVSAATLNQVGPGASGITSPTAITGSTLMLNGKPEVLYMGAEYCPYCGAERWAMIVALDKFGDFTGIEYMQSSSTDVYPNTPTFSFVSATYTSSYISFVEVEQEDRNQSSLQTATADETALMNAYDSSTSIPFIDFANAYAQVGSQYLPSVLINANWTQIASQLNNASSPYALNIDGAANRIISAICKIDGDSPTSVCSQSFAGEILGVSNSSQRSSASTTTITAGYVKGLVSGGPQPLVTDAVVRGHPPSARLQTCSRDSTSVLIHTAT